MSTIKQTQRRQRILATAAVGALVALGLAAAGSARAEGPDLPRVDERQAHQKARIQDGIASGELTRREAHGLVHQQAHIAVAERRAVADGQVAKAERARLHVMQDRASRQIARQKHDGQSRP